MRKLFNYIDLDTMYKFADKAGAIRRLKLIADSPEVIADSQKVIDYREIIEYAESLDEEYCEFVVGAVNKNPAITLVALKAKVEEKERLDEIRSGKKSSILESLVIDSRLKEWAIAQITIDVGNRELILKNSKDILDFIEANPKVELASYTVQTLLDQIVKSKDAISQYVNGHLAVAKSKLKDTKNPILIAWANKKYDPIGVEWNRKIRNAVVPFEQLKLDLDKVKQDADAGVYRGVDLPETPLRHVEYSELTLNLESLNDWQKNKNVVISNYSVQDAVKLCNEWRKEVADSGGFPYNTINDNNIVYGPNNWNDLENNGFIILELKDEKDLKAEGARLNHCVGNDSYIVKIKNKTSRIFSLRNISNIYNPILTIETDMSGGIVREDLGYKDLKSKPRYHDMVTEWSSHNKFNLEDLSYEDKVTFVSNITDLTALLEIIAKTDDPNLLRDVAENEAADEAADAAILSAIRQKLPAIVAKTDDAGALQSVAENPAADATILSAIVAKTDDAGALQSVAENPAADAAILSAIRQKLSAIVAKTDDLRALLDVARNQAADSAVLSAIRPKLSAIVAKTDDLRALLDAARNQAADATILSAIVAKTDNSHILEYVAKNKAVDATILSAIVAKTDDYIVLIYVARNQAADATILSAIVAKTDDSYVLRYVARNQAADATILSAIVAKTDDPDVLGDVARNQAADSAVLSAIRQKLSAIVAKTDDYIVLRLVAGNTAADATILLAIRSKTTDPELIELIEDKLSNMASIKSEASVNTKINNIHNKAIKYYLMAKYASY